MSSTQPPRTTSPAVVSTRTLPPEIDEVLELPTVQLEELQEESADELENGFGATALEIDDENLNGSTSGIVVELPTIHLDENDEIEAAAVAENVVSTRDIDYDVEGGKSTRQMNFSISSNIRAEFVSATFWKPTKDVPLGIIFLKSTGVGDVRIASLREGAMAADSPLRVGDQILSVNNKDVKTSKLTNVKVAQILKESVGNVTLVIHNEGGIPDLVESMIMKSEPTETVGISLKMITGGQHGGRVAVGTIAKGKTFQNSLLNEGDTVLAINGTAVAQLDLNETYHLIKDSPQIVTILARTLRDTGVVVAQISDRYLSRSSTASIPVLQGTATTTGNNNGTTTTTGAAAAATQNNGGTTTTAPTTDKKPCLVTIGVFALLIIVAVIIGTNTSQESSNTSNGYYYAPTPAPGPFELSTEPPSLNLFSSSFPYKVDVSGFPAGIELDDTSTTSPFYADNLSDCQSTCNLYTGYVAFLHYPNGISDRRYYNCQCLASTQCTFKCNWEFDYDRLRKEYAYLYSQEPLPTFCTTPDYC